MRKTLIREGLLGLNKKERQAFLLFMHSPYFKIRSDLVQIADFLLSDDVLDSDELTKEDVFRVLFPERPFDDQKMRLFLSYLQKKLELFLTIEELQKDSEESSWLLLRAMSARKLNRNFAKKYNFFQRELDGQVRQDWAYFFKKYRVELLNVDGVIATSKKNSIDFQVLTDSLDSFYLSAKLRHACSAMFYQSVFNQSYEFPMLGDILSVAGQEQFLKIPSIAIYYLFIKVMQDGVEVDFEKLKNVLFEQKNVLSSHEFREIYTMVLNFYIRKINQNRLEFVPEALSFYKEGLGLGLLLENGFLTMFKYSNIVAMGIQQGELEWVGEFIEKNKALLRKNTRLETYSLNKARLEYQLKHYDQALDLLTEISYNEIFYAITARIIKIKIYWEQGELDMLDHQLHSLKFYLKRKKVVGYHYYKLWTSIINYIRKLAAVNPYDEEKKKRLRAAIESEEILTEKAWLLEQLDKL